jgi:hypothetical protein
VSSAWAPMLPLAMVGTDRQAAGLPAWPGEVGQLVAQAASTADNPAAGVLRAAAVLATCSLAGAQGSPWSGRLPDPASSEALPTISAGPELALLTWTLQDGPLRLQQLVCLALATAHVRLPPMLLPLALDQGRRSLGLRPLLGPVLGERGLWLAAQRADWHYAAGVSAEAADETRWNEGSLEQRRDFLSRERSTDPRRARERLAQSLDELSAKERADLVGVLGARLSLEDEPLLESLRTDRSREVRQSALDLLLRLPSSAHAVHAVARVETLLKQERGLLRKRWQIDAPSAPGSDWKADNVDAARPKNDSLGDRAWWLYQLVRQVPPGWWTLHTGLDASELLRWASGTNWAEALVRGWYDAVFAAPEPAWCEAFLNAWPTAVLRHEPAKVLALLPLAARERYWQRHLRSGDELLAALVPQLLAACPAGETLSASLSLTLAEIVIERAESRTLGDDYVVRAALPELCAMLHIDALAGLGQMARHPDETQSFAETLHAMSRVIAVRRAFTSLATSTTPGTP